MGKPQRITHPATAEAVLRVEPFCRACLRKKIHRDAARVVAVDGNPSNIANGNLQPLCAVHAEEIVGSPLFLEVAA